MSWRSGSLIFIIVVAFASAVWWQYATFVQNRDFLVNNQISCDPATESCFQWDCDIATDAECDTTPYKKIEIKASQLTLCPNYATECPEPTCEDGDQECTVTYCSADTLEEGEVCSVAVTATETAERVTPETP